MTERKWIDHDPNSKQMKIGGTVYILYKIDFKTKRITRFKDRHFIMVGRTILQDDTIIINMYVPKKESIEGRGK